MNRHTLQSGYSLVEVLVAISILLLATVGPMTIAARSLQYAEFSAQQNTAYLLAQEGIEAVFKVRADAGIASVGGGDSWDWLGNGASQPLEDCFDGNGCGIDWRNENDFVRFASCGADGASCPIYFNDVAGRARYSHDNSGDETPYSRAIYLTDLSGGQVQVRSVVTWDVHPSGEERQVILETYLHDIYDF